MTGKRDITREDTLLKTRLISEGARFEVRGALQWGVGDPFVGPIIIFSLIGRAGRSAQGQTIDI